jgi:hypothetical protein
MLLYFSLQQICTKGFIFFSLVVFRFQFLRARDKSIFSNLLNSPSLQFLVHSALKGGK